ncbi:alpha/beta hydrolase-fold protein [Pedobacter sp.]
MIKKYLASLLAIVLTTSSLFAQNYERYKKLTDTTIRSSHLGFDKKLSILVPIEFQEQTSNQFPLIIVFDKQNKRSNSYILQTIDYLTSNEQMPSSIIISVESEQKYRYIETLYQISDSGGKALENEKFIFEELVPLAERKYKAAKFRLLIGHSRYGYFTSSLVHSRLADWSGIISMSPFFSQKNVELTDSVSKLNGMTLPNQKYYRFGIGNDYPDDFAKMEAVEKRNQNPLFDMKGYHFKEADHNSTPGLIIQTALYEIFERWSFIQSKYISNNQTDLSIKPALDKDILSHYGAKLNFSLGILNGKGWYFFNNKKYDKAIEAWKILLKAYPNFSEAYLYVVQSQIQLKQRYDETIKAFKNSLANSAFYTEKQKKDLNAELQELVK